jgi:hypothetical protein
VRVRTGLALALACALVAQTRASAAAANDVDPPERDPPPGLPRDPYAGLAPIQDDPFATAPPPESRSWVHLSVGIGGGSSRLGPIATEAAFEGHFFLSSRVSIGGRLGVLSFGEPDGNGASARFVTGLLGYRLQLSGDERPSEALHVTWLHVAAGAGWIGLHGYEKTGALRSDFDVNRLLVAGRAAVIWERGVFGTSIGLDLLGVPGQGFAALPTLGFGFMF